MCKEQCKCEEQKHVHFIKDFNVLRFIIFNLQKFCVNFNAYFPSFCYLFCNRILLSSKLVVFTDPPQGLFRVVFISLSKDILFPVTSLTLFHIIG